MKKLNILAIGLMAFVSFSLSSCKQENEAKDATVTLKVTGTTTESVTFEITTENAATYSYSFAASEEMENVEYVTEDAQNGTPVSITKNGLEGETEYTIRAYATNSDGKSCQEVTETATTTSSASVKIETIGSTPTSISFKLTPVNAVSVSYAVASPEEDVETIELINKTDGSEQELSEEDLEENTNYTVVATATNAAGEESARAYKTIKTTVEPAVEIVSVEPSHDQARVVLSVNGATQYAWAYTEAGAGEPERSVFSKVSISSSDASFIISGLSESTDYTVYVYAITASGYEGIIHSKDFSTIEYVEMPFEITVEKILSTDIEVAVSFDEELYSSYYLVMGPTELMDDMEGYDFESHYNGWGANKPKIFNEEQTIGLREFDMSTQLYLESQYNIGGVPIRLDGTVDKEATVWRQVSLAPVVFGESGLELTISDPVAQIDKVSFGVDINTLDNFDCLYIGVEDAGAYSNAEDAAKNVLEGSWTIVSDQTFFERDTTFGYRNPDTDYYIIAVAKDVEGKLSMLASYQVRTKSVLDEGDATCSINGPVPGTNSLAFDITFDAGTKEVLYRSQIKDEFYDENNFLKGLKVDNYNKVTQSGEFEIGFLSANTEYVVGFCAVAEDGTLGKHYIFEAATSAYVYDGNPEAVVEIKINGVTPNEIIYGYNVKISATPNEYVEKYYVGISDSDNESYFTKDRFTDRCMQGQNMEYTRPTELNGWDGSGESCGPKATIWVLAVDKDGKLVEIAETKVDDTW